jgi:hypothetical protein
VLHHYANPDDTDHPERDLIAPGDHPLYQPSYAADQTFLVALVYRREKQRPYALIPLPDSISALAPRHRRVVAQRVGTAFAHPGTRWCFHAVRGHYLNAALRAIYQGPMPLLALEAVAQVLCPDEPLAVHQVAHLR